MSGTLTGLEAMRLQGFPFGSLDKEKLRRLGVSDSLLRDLAGNSFASGPFVAVVISVLLHAHLIFKDCGPVQDTAADDGCDDEGLLSLLC